MDKGLEACTCPELLCPLEEEVALLSSSPLCCAKECGLRCGGRGVWLLLGPALRAACLSQSLGLGWALTQR